MRLHSLSRLFTAATALALLGGLLAQSPAAHADDWCWNDPVFTVNGQQTQVIVGVQSAAVSVAGTVANIVVYVPENVSTAVIVPPVLTPFAETLTFVRQGTFSGAGKIPVTVEVTFNNPVTLSTATQVTFPGGKTGTYYGKTGGAISVAFKV